MIAARRILVFTGAGVSAESGIPTFRGAGGIYTGRDPSGPLSIEAFVADPEAYWRRSRDRGRLALAAEPNPAHLAIAGLEKLGKVVDVVTQNTDGLHQRAGSTNVLELHGSGANVACLDCGAREARRDVQARLDTEMPPRCRMCGGRHLKPTVVLFCEPMPAGVVEESFRLARECDTCLVVGSSLVVQPAALVPLAAVESGAHLVIVNAEPTPMDSIAAAVVRARAGEALPGLIAAAADV